MWKKRVNNDSIKKKILRIQLALPVFVIYISEIHKDNN